MTQNTITITAPLGPGMAEVLTPGALEFVGALSARFAPRVEELLAARVARQGRIDAGERPDFLPATRAIREGAWQVGPIPQELQDRRVEITGPPERKMIINALNCGARVFMADFEDALAPSWANVVGGQANLREAVRGTLEYVAPEGKVYRLKARTAVLMVRPRGWHLPEKHALQGGRAVPGALWDFGLYLYHNAQALQARGTGPYFYLPKLESHLEARLWAQVFAWAERRLGLTAGTIKATVLIETILAVFEMQEILYELRPYAVGLNCGRWDYIFSFIKKFAQDARCVLPERGQLRMSSPFLRAYAQLTIQSCHRRGALALGGMAAQIPIKADRAANEAALAQVRADKEREALEGHDGTWVAHPGLVGVAQEVFDRLMPTANQLHRHREEVQVGARELLAVPEGSITAAGLQDNVSVALQYLAAWLGGNGCVPLNHLMEDAATAEISRAQLWQWLRHGAQLTDGRVVSVELFREQLGAERARLRARLGPSAYTAGHYEQAAQLLDEITTAKEFCTFLTLPAYDRLQ